MKKKYKYCFLDIIVYKIERKKEKDISVKWHKHPTWK